MAKLGIVVVTYNEAEPLPRLIEAVGSLDSYSATTTMDTPGSAPKWSEEACHNREKNHPTHPGIWPSPYELSRTLSCGRRSVFMAWVWAS